MSAIAGVVVTNTQTPLTSCPQVAYSLILHLDTAAQNNTSKCDLPPSLSWWPPPTPWWPGGKGKISPTS